MRPLSDVLYLVDSSTGCWVWQRALSTTGYGRMWADGFLHQAHRYFYEKHIGPIPDGLFLDHLCRNRRCVNPNHLEPVTNQENSRRGERAKLTMSQATEIRKLCSEGISQRKAATMFGIHRTTVQNILRNETWRVQSGNEQQIDNAPSVAA